MIDREKWAEIYDWARYNGFSPFDFISRAMYDANMSMTRDATDEEMIYRACRQFSINRTEYPKEDPDAQESIPAGQSGQGPS